MRKVIRWAVNNSPAMNTLMVGVLALGLFSLWKMRRETFPEFELEVIIITVPFPGASPSDVEEGVCLKIEESVRAVNNIKKQTSVAREGAGFVILELEADVQDVQKVLTEVRSEVDRISSFPDEIEKPEVKQITIRSPAIRIGIIAPENASVDAELKMRDVAEKIRDDLLQLKTVSSADIVGGKAYQIDVEIPAKKLREHNLTLMDVASKVRDHNMELPGGTIKTSSQKIALRYMSKQVTGDKIGEIPLIKNPGGGYLSINQLGHVRDEFVDVDSYSLIDGKPGLVITVNRASSEDLLAMVKDVREYVDTKAAGRLPNGYEIKTWQDSSVDVKDRLDLLRRNGIQGLILVFIVLAIFLEIKLAFWVALGIPIAILGSSGYLLHADQTLNMLSMFAFLMALGIVVDDAIVVGENIYSHRGRGKSSVQAAIDGTLEVLPAVTASVATTIIAFIPLMFVSGMMGKFIAVMPVAIIAMLVISLGESMLVLPCHLAHTGGPSDKPRNYVTRLKHRSSELFNRSSEGVLRVLVVPPLLIYELIVFVLGFFLFPFTKLMGIFRTINRHADTFLKAIIQRFYLPLLRFALKNPAIVLSVAMAMLLFSVGLVKGGKTPWVLMPKIDTKWIEAKVVYPDGTRSEVTKEAVDRIRVALEKIDAEYQDKYGKSLINVTHVAIGSNISADSMSGSLGAGGSHMGSVYVELIDTAEREYTSEKILKLWRAATLADGEFYGTQKLSFSAPGMGPGGSPIEFKLLAESGNTARLEEAIEKCKTKLDTYPGVFDIEDDSAPGKYELQMSLTKKAKELDVSEADLARTIRAAFYGEEVMRLQRGRHEVKLMVRYPRSERRLIKDLNEIRIRTKSGQDVPVTDLAKIKVDRGYAEINRVDQLQSITIKADVDEKIANASQILNNLKATFLPVLFEEYPELRIRWEGQKEQSRESIESLTVGFSFAVVAMFVLLTLQFRSYIQPLLVLLAIPFGIVGAIWGHAIMMMPITLFSLFGMVALTGVVVNDSIVLIDFINKRLAEGTPIRQTLIESGQRRFRPVVLTSITTVAGLFPLLIERSFQAQVLVPMATSLCFGLIMATGMILILVPTMYNVYYQMLPKASKHKLIRPALEEVTRLNEAVEKPLQLTGI